VRLTVNDRTYAVALSNTGLPAAAWYFLFHRLFVFSLAERKKRTTKEDKAPLEGDRVAALWRQQIDQYLL
jgi:hypothetical protein